MYGSYSRLHGYPSYVNYHPKYTGPDLSSKLGNFAYAGRGIPEKTYLGVNDPASMWTEQFVWTLTYPFIWAVNDWSGQTPPPWYPAFQPPETPSGPCK